MLLVKTVNCYIKLNGNLCNTFLPVHKTRVQSAGLMLHYNLAQNIRTTSENSSYPARLVYLVTFCSPLLHTSARSPCVFRPPQLPKFVFNSRAICTLRGGEGVAKYREMFLVSHFKNNTARRMVTFSDNIQATEIGLFSLHRTS